MSQKVQAPGRFWVVRKPDERGAIVARFETTADDPSSIDYEIPDDCVAVSVPGRSALADAEIDKDASPFYEYSHDDGGGNGVYEYVGI